MTKNPCWREFAHIGILSTLFLNRFRQRYHFLTYISPVKVGIEANHTSLETIAACLTCMIHAQFVSPFSVLSPKVTNWFWHQKEQDFDQWIHAWQLKMLLFQTSFRQNVQEKGLKYLGWFPEEPINYLHGFFYQRDWY